MNLSRAALTTAAAGFVAFGVACLFAPKRMLETIDVKARSARGTTELRAMYGGMELGLGAFFLAAGAKPAWTRPALLAQTLGLGGLGLTRLAGVIIDHPPGRLMKVLVVAELLAAAMGAAALAGENKQQPISLPRAS